MPYSRFLTLLASGVLALGLGAAEAAWDPFFAAPRVAADFGAATRPWGVAAGDFDGDGNVDLVVGRTTGNIAFVKGNGDGTFAAPVVFAWKQAYYNAWAFAAADINGDGRLDIVWGANASSPAAAPYVVNDGEVRAFLGKGDGTFEQNPYYVSGVLHNAGALVADVGTDAGSVAAGDVDGDGDVDIVAGAIDGANTVVKLLRNDGGFVFTPVTLISQPSTSALSEPIYYPATSTQNSPWGLALGDADGDGDLDLWVGDRALYVYLYENTGGAFSLRTGNTAVSGRPNVYLGHDAARAAVGYTPALAARDLNGDGRADLVLGLHSGAQAAAVAHDGELRLDVSSGGAHVALGAVGDVGWIARGLAIVDVNQDGALDIVAGEYAGTVKVLRQLPPMDGDADGISEYLDNAPQAPNAPRLDMNTDGTINYRDQLDNDADTVLGDPENPATWQRLGDPADPDDDNDGVDDVNDNCVFVANSSQTDADGDHVGDACDALDNRDLDNDGVPDGPHPGDQSFERSKAAKAKWASGTTHFVIRVDALGRFFQNEFTQILTDAAVLSPAEWATKCWENYEPSDIAGYQPCGDPATQSLTLPGGKAVPVTLVVIPKQLWTDPPVVAWINDRNDSPLFELAQHATYHVNNTPLGDWSGMTDRNFYACETCGLTEAENFELLKVGYDTLLGNYDSKWVRESGATAESARIDWATSFWPLLSFSPPYNTSDTMARKATSQFGFKAFSASWFEEAGDYAPIFSPEGSHHEQIDQFGMFHASADIQISPPDTTGDTYDPAAYADYLTSHTDEGGLTTWLIEEVDWSGRPCPNADRLGTCDGGSNRENNTVYLPRWNAWLQLLDFVKNYPGGVAMTMAEVALAKGFDNAPTVSNPDQADSDADGIGDVIDGATLLPAVASLSRNVSGQLSATLTNGTGAPIANQHVVFAFDRDGDGIDEQYDATTDQSGVATVTLVATRPVGPASFTATWDGILAGTAATGSAAVFDASVIVLDPGNPASGQVTDAVTVSGTLQDTDGAGLAGRALTFRIGASSATTITDASGHASVSIVLAGPAASTFLHAEFAGDEHYGATLATAAFVIVREATAVTLADAVAVKNTPAIATATLREADGAALPGQTLQFEVQDKVKGQITWTTIGTAVTNAAGIATVDVPNRYVGRTPVPLRVTFGGDGSFASSAATASVFRN